MKDCLDLVTECFVKLRTELLSKYDDSLNIYKNWMSQGLETIQNANEINVNKVVDRLLGLVRSGSEFVDARDQDLTNSMRDMYQRKLKNNMNTEGLRIFDIMMDLKYNLNFDSFVPVVEFDPKALVKKVVEAANSGLLSEVRFKQPEDLMQKTMAHLNSHKPADSGFALAVQAAEKQVLEKANSPGSPVVPLTAREEKESAKASGFGLLQQSLAQKIKDLETGRTRSTAAPTLDIPGGPETSRARRKSSVSSALTKEGRDKEAILEKEGASPAFTARLPTTERQESGIADGPKTERPTASPNRLLAAIATKTTRFSSQQVRAVIMHGSQVVQERVVPQEAFRAALAAVPGAQAAIVLNEQSPATLLTRVTDANNLRIALSASLFPKLLFQKRYSLALKLA